MTREKLIELKLISEASISQTKDSKTYNAKGKELKEIWNIIVDLIEEIENLNKQLDEKPKTITKIRYKKAVR